MSCDHLASHAIATLGAGLSSEARDHLQAVYDLPATLNVSEQRAHLVRAGKALALRLRAMGASLPDHLDFDRGSSRAAVRFGRLALALTAATAHSMPQTAPALPTEPLEAQVERWDAWRHDEAGEQTAFRAFFRDGYGDIAAYLNGREEAAGDCVRLLTTHREALIASDDMPRPLRAMVMGLRGTPTASQLRAVLTGLCQTAGHPRCGGCGQWCAVDDHRCPPTLSDLAADRERAAAEIAAQLPEAALVPFGVDAAGLAELRQTFLDRMRYLTDDPEAAEAYEPVLLKAQALRFFFQRAGAPIPPDLAAADWDARRQDDTEGQIAAFPTTWGGYAAVYDALAERGAFRSPRDVTHETPLLPSKEVPIWAVVAQLDTGDVAMRVPRPAGAPNYEWFLRLVPAEEVDDDAGPGLVYWDLEREPVYAVLVAAPPPPEDAPRWEPVDLARYDQPTQDAITQARAIERPRQRIMALMRVALRQEGRERRLLVEEAVGIARTNGAWYTSNGFASAAAIAALGSDEETAQFVVEAGIEEGEGAWATTYGEAATLIHERDAGPAPEIERALLLRALANARASDTADQYLKVVAGDAAECAQWDLALDAIGGIRSEFAQTEKIRDTALDCPPEVLSPLLALARTVGEPEYARGHVSWQSRAWAVSQLARREDLPDRAALAQEVYGLVARQEDHVDFRTGEALANVAPLLTPEQRQDAITRVSALGRSGAVSALESQVRGLTRLAGALAGAEREQAALAALERAMTLPVEPGRGGMMRYRAIGDLYASLPVAQRQAHFAGLLEAARSGPDDTDTWRILRGMLPYTEGDERDAVMAVVGTLKEGSQTYVLRVLTEPSA